MISTLEKDSRQNQSAKSTQKRKRLVSEEDVIGDDLIKNQQVIFEYIKEIVDKMSNLSKEIVVLAENVEKKRRLFDQLDN